MTLTKAIEILTLMGTPEFEGHTEDILLARKLGIEALEEVQRLRKYIPLKLVRPLRGETEGKKVGSAFPQRLPSIEKWGETKK